MEAPDHIHHMQIRKYFLERPGLNKSFFAKQIGCPRSAFSEYLSFKRHLPDVYIPSLVQILSNEYGYDVNFDYSLVQSGGL